MYLPRPEVSHPRQFRVFSYRRARLTSGGRGSVVGEGGEGPNLQSTPPRGMSWRMGPHPRPPAKDTARGTPAAREAIAHPDARTEEIQP